MSFGFGRSVLSMQDAWTTIRCNPISIDCAGLSGKALLDRTDHGSQVVSDSTHALVSDSGPQRNRQARRETRPDAPCPCYKATWSCSDLSTP